jgi:uncharacterized RmlC-like cupin family protein
MPPKTKTPSQAEMKTRIARFKDLVSTKARHAEAKGIPQEVMEMITAKSTFNVMSPADLGGQLSPKPAVIGGDAGVFRLGIATCPAGNGPGLHVHWNTHETFMALTGRWEIRWGDTGEESTIIEPFDLIAVPPGVTRQFINLSDKDAHLPGDHPGTERRVRRCRPRARNGRSDQEEVRRSDASEAARRGLAVHARCQRAAGSRVWSAYPGRRIRLIIPCRPSSTRSTRKPSRQ